MRSDDEIIHLCQQGRSEGFALLLDLYQNRVYRRAYSFLHDKEDALDATQDVFVRVLKAIGHFELGNPIWPWLRQITTNICLNRIRDKRSRPETVSFDEAWDQMDTDGGEGNPEHRALDAWEYMQLEQALGQLPPLHRMVVVLRHQEELSYEEISRAMNLPLGTVKTYLFRARRALREAMERSSRTG